jgi:hypothetical protein
MRLFPIDTKNNKRFPENKMARIELVAFQKVRFRQLTKLLIKQAENGIYAEDMKEHVANNMQYFGSQESLQEATAAPLHPHERMRRLPPIEYKRDFRSSEGQHGRRSLTPTLFCAVIRIASKRCF